MNRQLTPLLFISFVNALAIFALQVAWLVSSARFMVYRREAFNGFFTSGDPVILCIIFLLVFIQGFVTTAVFANNIGLGRRGYM